MLSFALYSYPDPITSFLICITIYSSSQVENFPRTYHQDWFYKEDNPKNRFRSKTRIKVSEQVACDIFFILDCNNFFDFRNYSTCCEILCPSSRIVGSFLSITFYFFREGAEELVLTLRDHNIPLIIFSAGIGNVIDFFLQKTFGGSPSNVHIVSNMMVITISTLQK